MELSAIKPTAPPPAAASRRALGFGRYQGTDIAPEPLPKLRELREEVFFRAEHLYLLKLVNLTGRNIHKACELSGLSRSRLYTLLKKYQINHSMNEFCR